jgi:hypothetical protein
VYVWKLVTAAVALAACAALGPGAASAAPDTVYCLNGQSTNLPAGVPFGGGSAALGEAVVPFIASTGGVFYAGVVTSLGRPGIFVPDSRGDTPPPGTFASGFSTNSVSLGPCASGASSVTYVSVCKLLARSDGTVGMFQQVTVADWNDARGKYYDAPAANWVEGLGLTCDNPLALGYRAAGYSVAWGGKRAPNHDAKGVRASGFNDIYPYFTK